MVRRTDWHQRKKERIRIQNPFSEKERESIPIHSQRKKERIPFSVANPSADYCSGLGQVLRIP